MATSRTTDVVAIRVVATLAMLAVALFTSGCPSDNAAKPAKGNSRQGSSQEEQRRNEKNLEQIDEARRKAEEAERQSKAAVTSVNKGD